MSNDTIPTKVCSKCGIEKPATIEYFHRHPNNGLHPRCKECRAEDDRKVREKHIANAVYVPSEDLKQCTKCLREFPATTEFFMWHKHSGSLYAQCHECRRAAKREERKRNDVRYKAYFQEWYEQNQEHIQDYRRQYYVENRDEIIARSLEYQKNNPDRVNAKNRKWYHNNPAKIRKIRARIPRAYKLEYNQRYMAKEGKREMKREWEYNRYHTHPITRLRQIAKAARRRSAEGLHTAEDIRMLYDEQEGRCAYCGMTLHNDYHLDHIIPLIRGGSNNPDNLACACAACNLSKGEKLLDEWTAWRGW